MRLISSNTRHITIANQNRSHYTSTTSVLHVTYYICMARVEHNVPNDMHTFTRPSRTIVHLRTLRSLGRAREAKWNANGPYYRIWKLVWKLLCNQSDHMLYWPYRRIRNIFEIEAVWCARVWLMGSLWLCLDLAFRELGCVGCCTIYS